jgi:mRNA interferase MazF
VTKGDIVLIPFPFTDLSGAKTRPALVLLESNSDITVSFITTQLKWKEEFDVELLPTLDNGLKKTSLVRLRKITTIDKALVIGRLGRLNQTEQDGLKKGLINLFELA